MTYEEKSVSFTFLMLVCLWFFRHPGFMEGWGDLLADKYDINAEFAISDSTSAVVVVGLLFVLPKKVLNMNFNK